MSIDFKLTLSTVLSFSKDIWEKEEDERLERLWVRRLQDYYNAGDEEASMTKKIKYYNPDVKQRTLTPGNFSRFIT